AVVFRGRSGAVRRPNVARGPGLRAGIVCAVGNMVVGRELAHGHSYLVGAAGLADGVCIPETVVPGAYRHSAAKIGEPECGLPVTTVNGSDQSEQSLVLADGHYLSGAKRPALGGKIESDRADLTYKWRGHDNDSFPLISRRENALQRNAI